MADPAHHSAIVKATAARLGFQFCGISAADFLEEEAPRLEQWLKRGMHGQMDYMARHFDKRLDPRQLVPGAKSVVSLLYNYYHPETNPLTGAPRISRYAYGEDYHLVIKEKLFEMLDSLREQIGEIHGRVFVDSAPVMEKAWAAKSGLGWVGKHTNLIHKQQGSWFFLAELIIDLPLQADGPVADYCGSCTRCIDACPTEAITPYEVDGSKCISYFTIELKEVIPAPMAQKFGNWLFGCDICQEVCPWNRFATKHQQSRFEPDAELLQMRLEDWQELTADVFNERFKKSPLQRTGFQKLQANLAHIFSSTTMQPEGGELRLTPKPRL